MVAELITDKAKPNAFAEFVEELRMAYGGGVWGDDPDRVEKRVRDRIADKGPFDPDAPPSSAYFAVQHGRVK